ncbi:MAG: glycosyltransferase family A protein [Pseudomonadota bacterium]
MSDFAETPPLRFFIVTASYQCKDWVDRCIGSVQAQTYPHYTQVLVDDCSTDGTLEQARAKAGGDTRFVMLGNTVRSYPLANIVRATREAGGRPDDVIVVLDGDDWLAHPQVLERLAAVYSDPAVWMSYGSHSLLHTKGLRNRLLRRTVRGKVYAYPAVVAELGAYRYYDFIAAHLRTYRRFLWDALRDEDLRDTDGGYYRAAADAVTMWPMLEMATPEHWRYLDEVLYIYNNQHGLSENRPGSRPEQLRVAMTIRAKPPYTPLERAASLPQP